jgi:putative transcriptional regulator
MDIRAPFLLMALPGLEDPEFSKTVVLIVSQDEEGAAGFVLNRPSNDGENGQAVMKAELRDPEGHPIAEFSHDLFRGGPLKDDALFLVHNLGVLSESDIGLGEGLVLSQDPDGFQKALSVQANQKDRSLKFFLGTSGWERGQLEQEIHQGLWYPVPLGSSQAGDFVFRPWVDSQDESVGHWSQSYWEELLASVGLDPKVLGNSGGGELN